jgi:hypothetical protein
MVFLRGRHARPLNQRKSADETVAIAATTTGHDDCGYRNTDKQNQCLKSQVILLASGDLAALGGANKTT